MGKKKKKQFKPFCYYCDREFDSEEVLIQHQKQRHFKCGECSKKLSTASGMAVHMYQVHNVRVSTVPNALPGKDSLDLIITGMDGVPEDDPRFGAAEAEESAKKAKPDIMDRFASLAPTVPGAVPPVPGAVPAGAGAVPFAAPPPGAVLSPALAAAVAGRPQMGGPGGSGVPPAGLPAMGMQMQMQMPGRGPPGFNPMMSMPPHMMMSPMQMQMQMQMPYGGFPGMGMNPMAGGFPGMGMNPAMAPPVPSASPSMNPAGALLPTPSHMSPQPPMQNMQSQPQQQSLLPSPQHAPPGVTPQQPPSLFPAYAGEANNNNQNSAGGDTAAQQQQQPPIANNSAQGGPATIMIYDDPDISPEERRAGLRRYSQQGK